MRRVPPTFSRPPELMNEVMLGTNLNLTCVAVGSPMPSVKWKKGNLDITPDDNIPIGINTLELIKIEQSANYTCIASSILGQIEANAIVKVQCEYIKIFFIGYGECFTFRFDPTLNSIQFSCTD